MERLDIQYREHPDYPGYRIGNDGTVWSRWTKGGRGELKNEWTRLVGGLDSGGYRQVGIYSRSKPLMRKVHRLVLEAFTGKRPAGMQCRHLDGDKKNNRLENLAWGTPKDNGGDKIKHQSDPRGERHHMAKLTKKTVQRIRALYSAGKGLAHIGRLFGIQRCHVQQIVRRTIWSHT